MIKVEKSIEVERPAEDVFAFVCDHTNSPRWQRGLLEVRRTSDGPIGVGTRHSVVRTFMGRRLEATNEFTEYEPDKLIAFKANSDSMTGQVWRTVEPVGRDRARVTVRMELRLTGVLGLVERPAAAGLKREVEADLVALKELLETEAAAARRGKFGATSG